MKSVSYRPCSAIVAFFLAAFLVPSGFAQTDIPITADDIIAQAVKRAQSPANHELRPSYRYSKHTVFEELDGSGRLKEHREKLYDVRVESGWTRLKLVELNGQPLSAAEQQKRDAEDLQQRQKLSDSASSKKSDERENFLTADLVARYKFTLLRQVVVDGRDTYEIAFAPRSAKLPVNHLTDRFLNQVAGTVWIDATEFEIARAEIHLQGEVSLWGGVVGTLTQCSYSLKRVREPDGVWFNGDSHGFFQGRKLLEPMLIRTRSDSTGFQKLDLAFK